MATFLLSTPRTPNRTTDFWKSACTQSRPLAFTGTRPIITFAFAIHITLCCCCCRHLYRCGLGPISCFKIERWWGTHTLPGCYTTSQGVGHVRDIVPTISTTVHSSLSSPAHYHRSQVISITSAWSECQPLPGPTTTNYTSTPASAPTHCDVA